ncbi:MAG: DUF421 domain-containing protein [Clostridia bacterium]
MLNLFVRCIIIFLFLLVAMRLMGKRQLGELQPFEFAITLVASDLACIPMSDPTIPIIYGILPVFTLFLLHILMTKIACKSVRFRKLLNGKPVVVIEKGNILPKAIKELNMTIDDLMEAMRGSGFFNPCDIEYAIIETNGSLTVMPKSSEKPVSPADLGLKPPRATLPVTLIMEGNFLGCNFSKVDGVSKERIMKMLERLNLKQADVLVLLLSGNNVFVQPYLGESITAELLLEDEKLSRVSISQSGDKVV